MLDNIPLEIRVLPQWVAARENKIPIDPKSNQLADVSNPATWGTFEQARATGLPHIGFVLSEKDPYTFIDLDCPVNSFEVDLHERILNNIDSYTERSQSGKGYHILVKGKVRSARRDHVELYSQLRYIICTGNVVRNAPVREYQTLLENMLRGMSPQASGEGLGGGGLVGGVLVDIEADWTDAEIAERAENAANGDKFLSLWRGEWQDTYPSQSEADLALMSMLAFYSKDNEQVRRLFRYSKLGQREKATKNDTYLNYALRRIRANELPEVDSSLLKARAQAIAAEAAQRQAPSANSGALPSNVSQVAHSTGGEVSLVAPVPLVTGNNDAAEGQHSDGCTFPPNLIGEVADYIYRAAPRQVKEVALAGALTLVSGVASRQYNISGTGLNLYTVLLAKTGIGKEGAATGISTLLKAVRCKVPMIEQFRGPATFASAPAIAKSLVEKPCQFMLMGEFGTWLKDLCDVKAGGPNPLLRRALLDLYQKSGRGQILMGTEYSDVTKNAKSVDSPSLVILGESTPETFFEGLDTSMLTSGLLPRFLTIEYTGERKALNEGRGCEPSEGLVERFTNLAVRVLQLAQNHSHILVTKTAEAKALSDAFEREATSRINQNPGVGQSEMWNRAHLTMLRLAGLYAVADNPDCPTVSEAGVAWSIALLKRSIHSILSRFEAGEVGTGDGRQLAELRKLIKEYYEKKPAESYKVPDSLYEKGYLSYAYLQRRTCSKASFSNAKIGATASLKSALDTLISTGELVPIAPARILKECGITQKAFGLGAKSS